MRWEHAPASRARAPLHIIRPRRARSYSTLDRSANVIYTCVLLYAGGNYEASIFWIMSQDIPESKGAAPPQKAAFYLRPLGLVAASAQLVFASCRKMSPTAKELHHPKRQLFLRCRWGWWQRQRDPLGHLAAGCARSARALRRPKRPLFSAAVGVGGSDRATRSCR